MEKLYKKKIKPQAKPKPRMGVDLEDVILDTIVNQGEDPQGIVQLSSISQNRDQLYDKLDDMCSDPTISAVLDAYVDDTTCIGDDGRIVYVDSEDERVSKLATSIIDQINVDKYISQWASCLVKYGDVYVRLVRQSDMEDNDNEINFNTDGTEKLHESTKLEYKDKRNDHYAMYCEMVKNPAEMFELKKHGKTMAYIRTPLSSISQNTNLQSQYYNLQYVIRTKNRDTTIFQPTEFVHGLLAQNTTRIEESIELFQGEDMDDTSVVYSVNRGQSAFYNTYPIWRQMALLEHAMLLNRINSSNVLRVIQVETGNVVDENQAVRVVTGVSNMLQTKLSMSQGSASKLYLGDTPTVNYTVMPTKNGAGAISSQEIGGKVENGDMDDINYFRNKLFCSLKVPKQYFGQTGDDSAGFDAGGSLAQLSMRYGKTIRRIQAALIEMITDIINMVCYDRGLDNYIGKFSVKMHFPVTQDDNLRQTYKKDQIDLVLRIMEGMEGVADENAKLKILKYLITSVVDDSDVLQAMQTELTKQAEEAEKNGEENKNENNNEESDNGFGGEIGGGGEEEMNMGLEGLGGEAPAEEAPVEAPAEEPME